MAATNFTPISLYHSATASAVPLAANLVAGELALNTNDGKLYYKNSSNVVTLLAGATSGPAGGSNTQVQFNSSGVLAGSANLTFNGTILTAAGFSGPINGTVGATTASTGAFTSLSDSGNLTFTGTGNRIIGDFSNATQANRVAFQTSLVNGNTSVNAIPNGTGNTSQFIAFNSFDLDNSSRAGFNTTSAQASFFADKTGTGTNLPMTFLTGGSERMRIDTSGNVMVGTTSTLGAKFALYGTASGTNSNIQITNPGFGTGCLGIQGTSSNFKIYNCYTSGTLGTGAGIDIDTSGNVGIGTSSPGAPLDVNGSIITRAAGGEGGQVSFNNPDNASVGLTVDVAAADTARIIQGRNNSVMQIGQLVGTGGIVTFFTAATERARIDSSGNLLVGTTTSYGLLSVAGSIAAVATPSTNWGVDFGASTSVPNYITLAPAATYDLAAGSGIIVLHNNNNGDGAVLFTYGGVVVKLGGSAAVVSGVGGASQIGLVYNSGLGKYRINNGYATSQSIFITTIRTRTSS